MPFSFDQDSPDLLAIVFSVSHHSVIVYFILIAELVSGFCYVVLPLAPLQTSHLSLSLSIVTSLCFNIVNSCDLRFFFPSVQLQVSLQLKEDVSNQEPSY